MSVNPDTRRLAIIETDHNAFNSAEKAELRRQAAAGDDEPAEAPAAPRPSATAGTTATVMFVRAASIVLCVLSSDFTRAYVHLYGSTADMVHF